LNITIGSRRQGLRDDHEARLLAAYEQLLERLLIRIVERCDPRVAWPQRIRDGLESLLAELAAQPEMARAVVCAFPSIQPTAYLRYLDFLRELAPLLKEGRSFSEAGEELPPETEMLAVASAGSLISAEIEAGRAQLLPALLPSILFSVLVPFVGPEAAMVAMRGPA
jgi:hypothetical protein